MTCPGEGRDACCDACCDVQVKLRVLAGSGWVGERIEIGYVSEKGAERGCRSPVTRTVPFHLGMPVTRLFP